MFPDGSMKLLVGATNPDGSAIQTPNASSVFSTELPSTTLTTSGQSATIPLDPGWGSAAVANVTAASGTLDLILQESFDNGANWADMYHMPRITAVGVYNTPCMLLAGRRRWKWVVSGSFTLSIATMRSMNPSRTVRSFYDRTITNPTLGATTAAFPIEGLNAVTMGVQSGSALTAGVMQLQFSQDGVNWFAASGLLTTVGGGYVAIPSTSGLQARYCRGIVTTAGITQTLTLIHFHGTS